MQHTHIPSPLTQPYVDAARMEWMEHNVCLSMLACVSLSEHVECRYLCSTTLQQIKATGYDRVKCVIMHRELNSGLPNDTVVIYLSFPSADLIFASICVHIHCVYSTN